VRSYGGVRCTVRERETCFDKTTDIGYRRLGQESLFLSPSLYFVRRKELGVPDSSRASEYGLKLRHVLLYFQPFRKYSATPYILFLPCNFSTRLYSCCWTTVGRFGIFPSLTPQSGGTSQEGLLRTDFSGGTSQDGLLRRDFSGGTSREGLLRRDFSGGVSQQPSGSAPRSAVLRPGVVGGGGDPPPPQLFSLSPRVPIRGISALV